MTVRTARFAFVLTVLALMALSLAAYSGDLPSWVSDFPIDKCVHATSAGLLVLFLDASLNRRMIGRLPLALPLVLVPVGIEEFLQRYSEIRSSSFADYAADLFGAFLFCYVGRRPSRTAKLA